MKAEWFKHTNTKEEEETLKEIFNSNEDFRSTIIKILERKKTEPLKVTYENPSWAYYRADMDGYNRALTDVIKLLGD